MSPRLGRMGALAAPGHNKIANPSSRLCFRVDAGNSASYPGTGSTWYDLSPYARAGGLSGTTWNSGGWFVFNSAAAADYSPAASSIPTGTQPLSMSVVFQTTTAAASQEIMGFGDISDTGRVAFWIDGSGLLGVETNGSAIWSSSWAGANTWVHLTAVSKGPNRHDFDIYVNGALVSTTTTGSNSARSVYNGFLKLTVGCIPWHPTVYLLNGRVALAKIWSVSLTAAQIDAEFQSLRSRFGL